MGEGGAKWESGGEMAGRKISRFPTSCRGFLAPLLPGMSKRFGAVFFCSRSMFSVKRSNRKRAMVYATKEKYRNPLKGKTENNIAEDLFPPVAFLYLPNIISRTNSCPFMACNWRSMVFQVERRWDFISFTLVDIKSVFQSINNYLLIIFIWDTSHLWYLQGLRDKATKEK